ncbi:DUF1643 domain-containing protein [Comamonas sp.]|uniref:DUF1643 domain-containing protein n=1 Tax=Comamonas sp. TaxID=34028 RepID=UPI0028988EC2|nr:DUF1643 domain-containing protein [Comamonas sp.]
MYDLYHADQNDQWRYTLGTSGTRPLITIGLNPSTATQEKSDPTVARVQKVAALNGYDGFVMLNLYPVRATDWSALPTRADAQAYARNLDEMEKLIAQYETPTLWAAWGETVVQRSYFLRARDELHARVAKYSPQWRMFGEPTASGHPRHPSRLNYDWKFQPYTLD